jgi:assimilatory nitrate reductase catalytic subunit
MERTVSRVRPATDTPSGVRQDIDIIAALGQRLCPGLLGEPPLDPEAVFREFCDLTADTDADCSGLSYTRLEAETAVRWPAPGARESGGYRYHSAADEAASDEEAATDAASTDEVGLTGADADWSFATPSGRARFSTAVETHDAEPTDEAYPLVLTTGREADGYNTGVRSRDGSGPGEPTAPVARVAPATMSEVSDGGREVSLASRRGSVDVTLHPDEAVPDGVVWLSIHHPATNRLTTPDRDPRSAEPNLKQCAVRVEARADESTAEAPESDEETAPDRPAAVGEVAE